MKLLARVASFVQGRMHVLYEIGLGRIGARTDFVGYERLLEHINRHDLWRLPGDILEIGAFMGGGTRKLAIAARKYGKRVVVVDVFEPAYDQTRNMRGESMAWIYGSILGKRCLRRIFDRGAQQHSNIVVYDVDSRMLTLPEGQRFAFCFVDGGHSADVVSNDFNLAWSHTVEGGVVAFHDYGGDLPSVTHAINASRRSVDAEVESEYRLATDTLLFLHKRRPSHYGRVG